MKKSWIVLGLIALVVILSLTRPPKPAKEPTEEGASTREVLPSQNQKPATAPKSVASAQTLNQNLKSHSEPQNALAPERPAKTIQPIKENAGTAGLPKNVVRYTIDQGLAVVQGDMVAGVPVDNNGASAGLVVMPSVSLWKSSEIPVFVQPNVSHPERVREALEMFAGTAVRFVPYSEQEDVLVFEEGVGPCKSYVGRIGGKQPIWISPGCGSPEVAHEILHALGFVHEQNRTDRDSYIDIYPDNIEEQYKYNFDKLPFETMKVSGLSEFDFESIMLYPPSMFAKMGQQTMRSKTTQSLNPSNGLSAKDKERLQKAYGAL